MTFPSVRASFGDVPTFVRLLLSNFPFMFKGKSQILLRADNTIEP